MPRPPASAAAVCYDGSETPRVILDAALRVFSDRGVDGAGTRAIAQAAGIEQGHLAYYFPSKMVLWQTAMEAFARDGLSRLEAVLASVTLDDPASAARAALPLLVGEPALSETSGLSLNEKCG